MTDAAFYCVADERYFLGAVAMINSLRLQGHREPIRLLDRGLAGWQRELLAGEVEIVADHGGAPPWLAKTVAPLARPAATMVLIDADIVATRPLGELNERAAADRVVVFRNDTDRFVAEWGELLDLGPARRRPYVTSGLVVAGGDTGRETIELLADRQRRVDFERTFARGDDPAYAFRYPEQDVLNAILATAIPEDRITTLPNRLAANPPYAGLRIVDERRLRCAYADGTEPFCLHQFVRKPWLEPMYHGIYSRLMARLLLAGDVAIQVEAGRVPRRMRSGALARLERAAVDSLDLGRWYLGERLPARIRRIASGSRG
jgi:hypothetical protein